VFGNFEKWPNIHGGTACPNPGWGEGEVKKHRVNSKRELWFEQTGKLEPEKRENKETESGNERLQNQERTNRK